MKFESDRVNISLSYKNISLCKEVITKAKIWEASWDVMLHAFPLNLFVSHLLVFVLCSRETVFPLFMCFL